MPKKSDRKEHESAMSSLLPEVSLEQESATKEETTTDGGDQKSSSTELKNSSDLEEENYSSTEDSNDQTSSEDNDERRRRAVAVKNQLPILPSDRPDLEKKLGPYVSKDVDEALEEVYLLLRRQLGGNASKSLIVEAALRFVLNDYFRREDDSEVANWLEHVLGDAERS